MLILKNKKGFTLIEVLCTITIFCILIVFCLSIQLNNISLKRHNDSVRKYSEIMEQIKSNMISNLSYEDIQNLKQQNKYYISKENINLDNLKGDKLKSLFSNENIVGTPRLVMNIQGDKVYKVNLKLYTKVLGKEKVLECEFYKGNYKK